MVENNNNAKRTPSKIGRYHILGHLATGGMAEVFLAKLLGPAGFERPVVIKRILPHLAGKPLFVNMFLDEARIAAGIRHPNVVQVHELGQADNELFIAMEYLEGESASGYLRRLVLQERRPSYGMAAYITSQVCAGMQSAHELKDDEGNSQNLVHRDISPANLFISYDGNVKVIDFGIAQATERVSHTVVGQVKGKFSYMSPEQCRGEPLDARSDVFALGICLYELSVGRRLFHRANDLMVLEAICKQPIPSPSRRAADYPPILERICMRAMQRDKKARYPSAEAMRQDLLTAIEQLGVAREPDQILRATMHELFADRVEEKKQMLRSVMAGDHLGYVPTAEADEHVDVPHVKSVADTGSEILDATIDLGALRSVPRRRSRAVPLLLGAIVLVAAAIAVMASGRLKGLPGADEPGATKGVGADSPAAQPPPLGTDTELVGPEKADVVELLVKSDPAGMQVKLDGSEQGTTPTTVVTSRGDEAVSVVLSLAGYRTLTQDVVPDRDQTLVLSAKKESSRRSRRSRRRSRRERKKKKDDYFRFE